MVSDDPEDDEWFLQCREKSVCSNISESQSTPKCIERQACVICRLSSLSWRKPKGSSENVPSPWVVRPSLLYFSLDRSEVRDSSPTGEKRFRAVNRAVSQNQPDPQHALLSADLTEVVYGSTQKFSSLLGSFRCFRSGPVLICLKKWFAQFPELSSCWTSERQRCRIQLLSQRWCFSLLRIKGLQCYSSLWHDWKKKSFLMIIAWWPTLYSSYYWMYASMHKKNHTIRFLRSFIFFFFHFFCFVFLCLLHLGLLYSK